MIRALRARRYAVVLALGMGFTVACLGGCGRERKETAGERIAPVAQGRAGGEETSAEGFRKALPGRPYSFPRDHASHPEFATEWWYYTGGLKDAEGRTYGYQLTFFRVGLSPQTVRRASAWAASNVYFAHMAVTDDAGKTHRFADRVARGSLGTAGAGTDAYRVHIEDWSARLDGDAHVLRAAEDGFGISLRVTPKKPPAIHGRNGVSQKAAGAGRASHYYSYTRMRAEGTLTLDGRARPVIGDSWFDHEFGSNQLSPNQTGWDWFSLQLDDGTDVMLYVMRTTGGKTDPYSSGTYVDSTGQTKPLDRDDYSIEVLQTWDSPETGAQYPAQWRVRVPSLSLDATVQPTVKAQEMRTATMGIVYWEGRVTLTGTKAGNAVSGQGYVELTGYAEAFRQTF